VSYFEQAFNDVLRDHASAVAEAYPECAVYGDYQYQACKLIARRLVADVHKAALDAALRMRNDGAGPSSGRPLLCQAMPLSGVNGVHKYYGKHANSKCGEPFGHDGAHRMKDAPHWEWHACRWLPTPGHEPTDGEG